jgi:Ala-tRNA(Pro) deacylase
MAFTRPELLAYLDRLGIDSRTYDHPPIHTVEDGLTHWANIPGGHAKNLFVKDKKSRLFLITLRALASLDIKHVHPVIGASGRVSFCSAEQLWTYLGVLPGSVTPFGLVNDVDRAVTFVVERQLLEETPVNFHPLENTATTSVTPAGLRAFLAATGHAPLVVDLPIVGESAEATPL